MGVLRLRIGRMGGLGVLHYWEMDEAWKEGWILFLIGSGLRCGLAVLGVLGSFRE
jgi:hypothetical protein